MHLHGTIIKISSDLANTDPSTAIDWLATLSSKEVINFNEKVDELVRNWTWSKYSREGLSEWMGNANLSNLAKSKFNKYIQKSVRE